MVIYRHKIWLRNLENLRNSRQYEHFKLGALILTLFAIILTFTIKITNTVNAGLEANERASKIVADVNALEKQNAMLKYERDLYNSPSEIEAQIRVLGNKKKEGEQVFVVSGNRTKDRISANEAPIVPIEVKEEVKTPNWQKWLNKVF